jgi:cytidylate kinase
MDKSIAFQKAVSFVKSGPYPKTGEGPVTALVKPAITISRMTGAGGHVVATELAEYLQSNVPAHDPWTVYDQNLVEKVLEDHKLEKSVADAMAEEPKSMFADLVDALISKHPSSWTLVEHTNATILRLATSGNVILVGRGAVAITHNLSNVFHVYLVGSLEKRIEYGQRVYGVDRNAALNFIRKRDEGRRRYLKEYFEADVDDPLLYHVVINTDLMRYDEAARMVGDEVIKRFGLKKTSKRRENSLTPPL